MQGKNEDKNTKRAKNQKPKTGNKKQITKKRY